MTVMRSLLFVPANSMRMIYKSVKLNADGVILDLEDAVPMLDKETGRIFVRDSVKMVKSGGSDVFVRINALTTGFSFEDLSYTIQEGLDGIMLPKCSDKKDMLELSDMISEFEKERRLEEGSISIIPLIESSLGVLNAYEIASSSERVIAIAFGAVDFTRELGTTPSKEGTEIFHARAHISIAARAANVQSIDTVWIDIMDMEGLVKDAMLARSLGFRGKLLIHPKQIEPANRIFTPSEEEISFARRVVEVFSKAQAEGKGATSIDGTMVDIATFRQAEELLSLVKEMRERESKRIGNVR